MSNILPPFDARAWFWIVDSDESRAWSSAASAYVATWDADRTTRIDSEQSLSDVLRPYGLRGPHVSQEDYVLAIEAHVDEMARKKAYGGAVSLASYVNSTIPLWAAEAQTFVAWRDAVWLSAYTTFGAVQGGATVPTIDGLIADLPPIAWPD